MTQKNFMCARALTMTELENVNGGIRVKTQGGATDPRQKTKNQGDRSLIQAWIKDLSP